MTRSRELAELATAYDTGTPLGMRNRIINGDMRIDQRNAGASVTPADGAYTLDRWRFSLFQASKLSVQQSTTAPSGYSNSMLVTSLSAYSVLAGDIFATFQRIEGFNTADLGWGTASAQTVTLSFQVRSSLTGTFGGSLRNSANDRSYPFTFTVSAANTFETKTITIPGDTSGTWVGSSNGTGIQLTFGFGVGSTYSGTAGAWAAGNFASATGAVSVVGTSGATFYLTGVQLEAGSVATAFERRPYGTELQLAQRYFEAGVSVQYIGTSNSYQYSGLVYYKVTKRAAATVLGSNQFNTGFPTTFSILDNNTQGFTQYRIANATVANGAFGITWTADAEL